MSSSRDVVTQKDVYAITKKVIESLRSRTYSIQDKIGSKRQYSFSYFMAQLNYCYENEDESNDNIDFVLAHASLKDLHKAYNEVIANRRYLK